MSGRAVFAISYAVILLCWIPVWLSEYPAVMSPDSISQAKQFLGLTPLVNHHPVAHTMWNKLWYAISNLSGERTMDESFGFISLTQLLIMDFIFSIVILYIYKKTCCIGFSIASLIFYGFVSYNSFYSVTLWKDVLHGGISALLLVLLLGYFGDCTEKKRKSRRLVYIFILSCAFCLFRSNGYYAFAIWTAGVILYGLFHNDRGIAAVAVLALIISTVIIGPVYSVAGVMEGGYVDSLSVPLQQISRVVKNGKELKEEERELLEHIVDIDKIPEAYKEYISDPIKGLFNAEGSREFFEEHKLEFLKLWVNLGIRYPKDYIKAWIKQTQGYWYPDTSYWVYTTGVYQNDIGINKEPLVPDGIVKQVEAIAGKYKEIPLYGSFWNLGVFTWVLIIVLFYCAYREQWNFVLVYMLLFCVWLSIIISTPVYAEFRYYYSVVASLPLIIFMPLTVGKNEGTVKNP